jgi:hypothetical protein
MRTWRASSERKTMKNYTIELTEDQLKGLAYACRVTDRLIIGQLDFSLQECCEAAWERRNNDYFKPIGGKEWQDMRNEVERHIDELRQLCWGQDKATLNGVGYDKYADMLFDMQKVIEHALWLERPANEKSHYTNDAFPHEHAFGGEHLMKVKPCR